MLISAINTNIGIGRRIGTLAAIAAIGTTSLAATPVANADRKQGSGGTNGCEIYNEDTGKTETVPAGTKVGLFTCGSDGEWHFGWLVNAAPKRSVAPVTSPKTLKVPNRQAVRLARIHI